MNHSSVALVTGANQGIGLQIAKDLTAHGLTVLVGSRDFEKGKTAAESVGKNAHALQLDVTDSESISAAAARIRREFGRLDVLVNNAGISHGGGPGISLEKILESDRPSRLAMQDLRRVFETNVFGVVAVTQAMLPLLREAAAGRVVNVSSTMGSLTMNADPDFAYRTILGAAYGPSKSALNAITIAFAIELQSTAIKVNAVCPGYTATALNDFQGRRSVEQAAREPVRLALLDPDGPTGTFSNADGPLPW
jgi:NAD(P)-dependent dehydrogenase (short-subunit alcohol dehydrogenase family)